MPPLTPSTPSIAFPKRIVPLPPEVAARLRSTLTITSLTQAISELVQNSLDAEARTIRIQVNFVRNSCSVEDDGYGISPDDLPLLGQRYATSKYTPRTSPSMFGQLGVTLTSLATDSLLTIVTRASTHRSTSIARFSYSSKPVTTGPAPDHLRLHHSGTNVRIEGLFANVPVRVKVQQANLDEEREWEELKRVITSLILAERTNASRNVAITLRDTAGRKLVMKPRTSGDEVELDEDTEAASRPTPETPPELRLLQQVYSVKEIGLGSVWERVKAKKGPVSIEGWICTSGSPTKRYQFISINSHPLSPPPQSSNVLHSTLNKLFSVSTFGIVIDNPDESTTKKANKPRKGVDRFPRCVLRIECLRDIDTADAELVVGGEGGTGEASSGKGGVEGENLRLCVELLQRLVEQFLKVHYFKPTTAMLPQATGEEESAEREITDPASSSVAIQETGSMGRPTVEISKPITDFFQSRTHGSGYSPPRPSTASSTVSSANSTASSSRRRARIRRPSSSSGRSTRRSSSDVSTLEGWRSKVKSARKFPIEKEGSWESRSDTQRDIERSFTPVEDDTGPTTETPIIDAEAQDQDDGDGYLHWRNPITNQVSYIDSRTGNTIRSPPPIIPSSSLLPSSASSSSLSSLSSMSPPPTITLKRHRQSTPDSTSNKRHESERPSPGPFITSLLETWENPVFGINPATGLSYAQTEAQEKKQDPIPSIAPPTSLPVAPRSSNVPSFSSYFPLPEVGLGAGGVVLHTVLTGGVLASTTTLTRKALKKGRVIGQVDGKFILVVMKSSRSGSSYQQHGKDEHDKAKEPEATDDSTIDNEDDVLVLIDQHAGDERWRVEALFEELCRLPSPDDGPDMLRFGIATTPLTPVQQQQLTYTVSETEYSMFAKEGYRNGFAEWGVGYDLPTPKNLTITLTHIPRLILDRIIAEKRLGGELLRGYLWEMEARGVHINSPPSSATTSATTTSPPPRQKRREWYLRIPSSPKKLREMVNSRACRSAVMFGDKLDLEECRNLVARLAGCRFWGVCAHGRPGAVGVVRLRGEIGAEVGMYSAGGLGVGRGWGIEGEREGREGREEGEGEGESAGGVGVGKRWDERSHGGFKQAYKKWRARELEAERQQEDQDAGENREDKEEEYEGKGKTVAEG